MRSSVRQTIGSFFPRLSNTPGELFFFLLSPAGQKVRVKGHAVKDLIASEPANNPLIRPVGHLFPLPGGRDFDKAAENMIINP